MDSPTNKGADEKDVEGHDPEAGEEEEKAGEISYNKDDDQKDEAGDEGGEDKPKKKKKKKSKKAKEGGAERLLEKRPRRPQLSDVDTEKIEKRCEQLIADMEKALTKDVEAIEKGVPALARLKLLPQMEKDLKSQEFQEQFSRNQGFDILATWLRKLPDGNLPSKAILEKLLGIVSNINIADEIPHSISKALNEMKREIRELRDPILERSVTNITDRWARMTYIGGDNEQDELPRRKKKQIHAPTETKAVTLHQEGRTKGGSGVLRNLHTSLLDFSREPQSKAVTREAPEEADNFRKNLRKAQLDLARALKK